MGMLIISDEKQGGVMKKIIVMFGLLVVTSVMAYAAETITDDGGTAKAKIIQAATLTHQTGALDFGVLIADADGGSSTLAAVASPTPTDSGLKRATGNVSSDHFVLANLDTATTYHVSIPADVTITNGSDSSKTMSVALTLSDDTVTSAATKDLYVGGTLTVGNNQAAGVYTGNYTMAVTY